jgi:hypothetical protein
MASPFQPGQADARITLQKLIRLSRTSSVISRASLLSGMAIAPVIKVASASAVSAMAAS